MQMPGLPRPTVRDKTGRVIQPEYWTDEERHQYHQELADQFRQGEQVHTLDQLREEMTERWKYVDSWEEQAALREWICRQVDGLIDLDTNGQTPGHPMGSGSPQFLDPLAADGAPGTS